jgi:hypothetical protein
MTSKPDKTKIVYMVPYFWNGRVKFVRFHSETYEEALRLAQCMFGENAYKYLYQKEYTKD